MSSNLSNDEKDFLHNDDDEPLDILTFPIVHLPGSDRWVDANGLGVHLDGVFPGQDAWDFAYACDYNDYGPLTDFGMVDLTMVQAGDRDGESWIWHVTLANGEIWEANGWCDYTGWDCQSSIDWKRIGFQPVDPDELAKAELDLIALRDELREGSES